MDTHKAINQLREVGFIIINPDDAALFMQKLINMRFKKEDIKEVGLTRYNSYNCCIDEVTSMLMKFFGNKINEVLP